jgi:hypothetical protein
VIWTDADRETFRRLVDQQFNAKEISRLMGRSPGSLRWKAEAMGLKLSRAYTPETPAVAAEFWTDADRLSQWARVPHSLAELVVSVARQRNHSLKYLRSGSRRKELVRCRWEIAAKARKLGHSYERIGRALNRDHSTIIYAMQQVSSAECDEPVDDAFADLAAEAA